MSASVRCSAQTSDTNTSAVPEGRCEHCRDLFSNLVGGLHCVTSVEMNEWMNDEWDLLEMSKFVDEGLQKCR